MTSANPRDTKGRRPIVDIPLMSRGEFLNYWKDTYQQGQHVTFLGPTQRGKTTLCHQMLAETVHPDHKAVILAGKPPGRDGRMETVAGNLNMRMVDEWPHDWNWKDKRRNGYVLRPKHYMKNSEATDANLKSHFHRALVDNYASKKPVISVVDEAHHVHNDLGLKKDIESPLMRGAPVNGVWLLLQRGRFITYHAYAAPEYVLIANDPDLENQKRYSEIGGVDPRLIKEIVASLKTRTIETAPGRKGTISEFVVIQRSGPEIFIVDVS